VTSGGISLDETTQMVGEERRACQFARVDREVPFVRVDTYVEALVKLAVGIVDITLAPRDDGAGIDVLDIRARDAGNNVFERRKRFARDRLRLLSIHRAAARSLP